jgi:hypothetical protein
MHNFLELCLELQLVIFSSSIGSTLARVEAPITDDLRECVQDLKHKAMQNVRM